jgi:hypothetical protein
MTGNQIPCIGEDVPHQPELVCETLVAGAIIKTWKCAHCHVEWRTR